MDRGIRHGVLILMLMAGASRLAAQNTEPPAEASSETIAKGKALFAGKGLCLACHGVEGRGGVGPVLADTIWLHGTGTYPEILARILAGVPEDSSVTGAVMPPRGGSALSDADVKLVAAYVWSLSRPRRESP